MIKLGWREWLALPDYGIDWIKVKVDTGARSSALHVTGLKRFSRKGTKMVRFVVHPLQRRRSPQVTCEAEVIDRREVTNSSGRSEKRYFVEATVGIGVHSFPIELSLACRERMKFRMLLGRSALVVPILVDANGSYLTRTPPTRKEIKTWREKR